MCKCMCIHKYITLIYSQEWSSHDPNPFLTSQHYFTMGKVFNTYLLGRQLKYSKWTKAMWCICINIYLYENCIILSKYKIIWFCEVLSNILILSFILPSSSVLTALPPPQLETPFQITHTLLFSSKPICSPPPENTFCFCGYSMFYTHILGFGSRNLRWERAYGFLVSWSGNTLLIRAID